MFVVGTPFLSLEIMKLTVISANGTEWIVDVLPEFTIDKLKCMALSHFFNPIDIIKFAETYKLVSVSKGRSLSDSSTVRDESLPENDELLLLKSKQTSQNGKQSDYDKQDSSSIPNEKDILAATADVEPKNLDRHEVESLPPVDFHSELRKILVSLIKVSAVLINNHPNIVPIFKNIRDRKSSKADDSADCEALKQLTDMGFLREKAMQALKLNKMSPIDAMDWLLAHEIDSTSITKSSDTLSNCTEASTENNSASASAISDDNKEKDVSVDECSSSDIGSYSVSLMLECFKAYKNKLSRPNTKALQNLKEMGFSENEVLDALRINSNNQDAACEWLLNNTKPTAEDLEIGLDPSGPVYAAVMENPVVQLGLNNPKIFLALLHMLENPNSAHRQLGDPDTAPIFTEIFQVYHGVKHSLHIPRSFYY